MRALFRSLWFLGLVPLVSLADPVNINTADAVTLSRELKGVGEARAQAIIEYRTSHGPFKSPDELALVKGIGQKVIDANRANIRVEPNVRGDRAAAKPATASSRKVPPKGKAP